MVRTMNLVEYFISCQSNDSVGKFGFDFYVELEVVVGYCSTWTYQSPKAGL